MDIRTVLKKGTDHLVNCEDDLFFYKYTNGYSIGAIFDGCSTGIKSHFASNLFSKILIKVLNTKTFMMFDEGEYTLEEIAKQTFIKFFNKLNEVVTILGLSESEILSTIILTIIKDNNAYIIVSGDGCLMVDKDEYKLESPENTPDYLAYHLSENVLDVYDLNIKKFAFENIEDNLAICSDGIYSFRHPDQQYTIKDVIECLLDDKSLLKSDAMLSRKYNILIKNGFSNYDDLSIVRFIF